MNAFYAARGTEAKGMAILLPYLEERSGRYVLTSKGTLARHLQLIAGDVLLNTVDEKLWAVEIKVEEKHTGNLFLETWSNRNLNDKSAHAERGSNPGWLVHCRADALLYYFLDTDDLYTINLFRLKRWAFGSSESAPHIYLHSEKPQSKYVQPNDTHGRVVPISVLHEEISSGIRHCKVRQLSLLSEAA